MSLKNSKITIYHEKDPQALASLVGDDMVDAYKKI